MTPWTVRDSKSLGKALILAPFGSAPEEQENPPWQATIADIDLNYVDDHGHIQTRRPEIYQTLTEIKP